MIKSAAKLGFFGVLTYFFARAIWSLFSLLIGVIGGTVLLGCLFAWIFFATSQGWLVR